MSVQRGLRESLEDLLRHADEEPDRQAHLEAGVMPDQVQGRKGLAGRPEEHAPPEDRPHADERPHGKPPKPPKKGAWSKPFKVAR